jgi:hypothetical protein
MLGFIVCCVCWELILQCFECWVLLFVVYTGNSLFIVWNAGFYCLLCILGTHYSLFGMLGFIVCCVCWELILLCFECLALLFVVYAGSSFFLLCMYNRLIISKVMIYVIEHYVELKKAQGGSNMTGIDFF